MNIRRFRSAVKVVRNRLKLPSFTYTGTLMLSVAILLLVLGGCSNSSRSTESSSAPLVKSDRTIVAVSTAGSQSLVMVNPGQGTVVREQPTPANAHGVAALNQRIFLGDRRGEGMYVIERTAPDEVSQQLIDLDGPAHHLASGRQTVYATVTKKNFVAVVNETNGESVQKIPMPKPYYPLVVPELNRLYVTSKSTGTVREIDLSTQQIVGEIEVGKAPSHLAYAGGLLWITNAGSGDVSVVNPATNREVKRIRAGPDPHGVAYDPSTNLVFVSNRTGQSVSTVDVVTRKRVETFEAGGVPDHLTAVNGRILVALRDPGKINVLDPETLSVERTIDIGMEPHQMVVMPNNIQR